MTSSVVRLAFIRQAISLAGAVDLEVTDCPLRIDSSESGEESQYLAENSAGNDTDTQGQREIIMAAKRRLI